LSTPPPENSALLDRSLESATGARRPRSSRRAAGKSNVAAINALRPELALRDKPSFVALPYQTGPLSKQNRH
jgi:hypothetical protein